MSERAAHIATNVGAPWVLNAVLPVLFAVTLGAFWWGLLVSAVAGVLPVGLIVVLMLRRRVGDVHVRARGERAAVIGGIITIVLVGLVIELCAGAPEWTVTVTASGLATIMLVGVVTVAGRYKISVHTAVAAGWIVLASALVSPWALLACPIVAVIGRARVVLGDHTAGQALWGVGLGAATAAVAAGFGA